MTDKRYTIGVIITVIWLVAMVTFAVYDLTLTKAMKPHEWGDFFAGFFAPLAFLWLVLGYLQQGQELQLSTQALQLQAEELKNSVEQQRELVEVTRLQVDAEREALHSERLARKEAAKPSFIIKSVGGSNGSFGCHYQLSISNAGNNASEVRVVVEGVEFKRHTFFEATIFNRSSTEKFYISLPSQFPASGATFFIYYRDADGQSGSVEIPVVPDTNKPQTHLCVL